ncbi:hypothetical protein ACFLSZ_04935 [Candidatus Bipolaricaulota bacterium]
MLNRCVVTVRAKEPFLRWMRSLSDVESVSLDEINLETTAYLLPDYGDDEERQLLLVQFYDLIFEDQLAGWWTEKADWPEKRDLVMFTRWFSVDFHSILIDLVDGVLRDEE